MTLIPPSGVFYAETYADSIAGASDAFLEQMAEFAAEPPVCRKKTGNGSLPPGHAPSGR